MPYLKELSIKRKRAGRLKRLGVKRRTLVKLARARKNKRAAALSPIEFSVYLDMLSPIRRFFVQMFSLAVTIEDEN